MDGGGQAQTGCRGRVEVLNQHDDTVGVQAKVVGDGAVEPGGKAVRVQRVAVRVPPLPVGGDAVKGDDEIATPDDFFERRIIPAHLAPPMVIRGPVSVFQLGAACT